MLKKIIIAGVVGQESLDALVNTDIRNAVAHHGRETQRGLAVGNHRDIHDGLGFAQRGVGGGADDEGIKSGLLRLDGARQEVIAEHHLRDGVLDQVGGVALA